MSTTTDDLATALLSEIFMADQLAHNKLRRALPKGMELSQFSVLSYLARLQEPKTPAQLAKTFNLTRGAMTNTLNKLEWAGHIHISPDWEDARRKNVVISPAGRKACETAVAALAPIMGEIVEDIGPEKVRATLPVLRALRERLTEE